MKQIKILFSLIVCINCVFIPRPYGYILTETITFTESGKAIDNPNRGFYSIYGFTPSDGGEIFNSETVKKLKSDTKSLALIQINLRNYSDGPISESGLKQIGEIFNFLKIEGKEYLIRFLYDWDRKIAETEPENAETILTHMKQLEFIFREYEDIIFVHQGLFIGNWGEMNGTKHLDSMKQLALQLAEVTGENTFLSVRTPAQWRTITEMQEITEPAPDASSLAGRLGLFNDGMMGNAGDYGTYGSKSKTETGVAGLWNREEELDFQSELCRYVPNGGEVIINNPLNDFENAVETLKRMHVSYLNRDYDRNVLNKWKEYTVTEDGCFYGMDGLTYIERHLGYRLCIRETDMAYNPWRNMLSVEIALQNVGFAPVYRETEGWLTIYEKETGEIVKSILVEDDIRKLAGGVESEQVLNVTEMLYAGSFGYGEYEVYFAIKDMASESLIELANEQELSEKGYYIGEFNYVPLWIGLEADSSVQKDENN